MGSRADRVGLASNFRLNIKAESPGVRDLIVQPCYGVLQLEAACVAGHMAHMIMSFLLRIDGVSARNPNFVPLPDVPAPDSQTRSLKQICSRQPMVQPSVERS